MVLYRLLQVSIKYFLVNVIIFTVVCHSMSLDTRNTPRIIAFKKTILVFLDPTIKSIELKCDANTIVNTDINFYFNDVLIERNGSNIQNVSMNVIRILNIPIRDVIKFDGVYKCVACNMNGCSMKKMELEIPVMGDFLKGNRFTDPPKILEVRLNHKIEIFCPTHSLSRPLKIKWGQFNPMLFLEESKYVNFVGDKIYVSNVTSTFVEEINNKFKGISCVLLSDQRTKFSARIKLKIVEPGSVDEFKPQIYLPFPKEEFVTFGDSYTFRCLASANPCANITWYRNNERILPGDYMFEMDPAFPKTLTIEKFDRRYIGKYECIVRNEKGEDKTEGNLTLAELPRITSRLHSIGILKNRTLNVSCEAEGSPTVKVEWLRNGLPVKKSLSGNKQHGSRLIIQTTRLNDSGTYQCVASNTFGEDSKTINLVVVSTEHELAKLLDTAPAFHDSASFLQCNLYCLLLLTLLSTIWWHVKT